MRKTSDIIWQDAQHQVLFDILDRISDPDADGDILSELQAYTEYHFTLEEAYMERLGFPGRDSHVRAHNVFRREIAQLLLAGNVPDPAFRQIIATFLTEWLTRHVFGIDKRLEDFILHSDVR